jgi:Asp-tRNA(Asn)/Glu-tRNA(Gln) amidotransferase A subunit family amidase
MSPGNLPIGIQIVGPYWSEPELIRFAGMMASLGPGFTPPVLH